MNANEYGISFVFSVGFNMQAATGLEIWFERPDGTTFTVGSQGAITTVTAPPVQLTTTAGIFLPYNYAQYTFQNGDVTQAGCWSARVLYWDTVQHLISDIAEFPVGV